MAMAGAMLRRRTCCLALLLLGVALTGAAAEEAAADGAAGAEATPTPDAAAGPSRGSGLGSLDSLSVCMMRIGFSVAW